MPRRDDYDDDRDRPEPLGPLDKMYRDTNVVVLVIFGLCCSYIAFILSLVALLTAKDPQAKSNATICLIISGIVGALGAVAQIFSMSQTQQFRR